MNIPSPNGTLSIESEIGSGAYGFVLKVSNTSHPAVTALKVVPVLPTGESNSGYEMKQAEREQRFHDLSKLAPHPNVVQSHATWATNLSKEGYLQWRKNMINSSKPDEPTKRIKQDETVNANIRVFFLRMEYCAMGNLEDWFLGIYDYYRLTYNLRISLYRGAVEGVNFLHSKNVIHRDLSPKNILISFDSNNCAVAKVSDFSTVTSFGTQAAWKLTRTRDKFTEGLGTDPYRAPECNGLSYDESVDVYALGVIGVKLFYNIKVDRLLVDRTLYLQTHDKWLDNADFLKNYTKVHNAAVKQTDAGQHDIELLLEKASEWFSILKLYVSLDRTRRPTCAMMLERMLPSSIDATFGDGVALMQAADCIYPLYTLTICSLALFKEQLRIEVVGQLQCKIDNIGPNDCVISIEESATRVVTNSLQCVTDVIEILHTKILLDSTLQKMWLWDEMRECIVRYLLKWRQTAYSHMCSSCYRYKSCIECVKLKSIINSKIITDDILSELCRVVTAYSWGLNSNAQNDFRREVSMCVKSAEDILEFHTQNLIERPVTLRESEICKLVEQIAEQIAAYCLNYAQQSLHQRCGQIVCDREVLMDAAYSESFTTMNEENTIHYRAFEIFKTAARQGVSKVADSVDQSCEE